MELLRRIESRKAVVGVIGLGYVGIAVAAALADVGFRVLGVDKQVELVRLLGAGELRMSGVEPELREIVARVVASRHFAATTEYAALVEAEVVLVAVQTPLTGPRRSEFAELRQACRELGRVLRNGALVVIESTVAPGTCASVIVPLLEQASGRIVNDGFFLGHCPERVMRGRLMRNLRELSRVCGGTSSEACDAMVAIYRAIGCGPFTKTDCLTAELVKTAENAYRDVNIAFANELALVCEAVGGDFERVRELVNECPGRHVLAAGPGVGGHCIPKDPWLLVQGAGVEARVIAAARAVNESMPGHVVGLIANALAEHGVTMQGARVCVLGYAYLENTDDARNSPSAALVRYLHDRGAETVVHDPWIPSCATDMWEAIRNADAVVIMVAHDCYRDLDPPRLCRMLRKPVVVDGRRVLDSEAARKAGLSYRAVGFGITRSSSS